MQHEVVLALLGCPGELIRPAMSASGEAVYEVDPAVPFLSVAERHAINQVASLGAAYAQVLAYVDGEDTAPTNPDRRAAAAGALGPRVVDGLYNRALKAGLEEQLDEYRDAVVALEAELLMDPSRPLSHLRFKLHARHFHLTLPALSRLVATVSRRGTVHGVAGAQLLELLHEGAACASQPVAACLHRVARPCHAVLYNLCAAWTLHGRLLDPHHEFFVSRGAAAQRTAAAHDAAPWTAWASGAWDAAPWDPSAVPDQPPRGDDPEGASDEAEWHQAFVLRVDAVPLSYLPSSLAHQVLFVGKATRALARGTHVARARGGEHDQDGDGDGGDGGGGGGGDGGGGDGGSLTLSEAEVCEFAAAFERLKRAEVFHLLSLEALVRSMHAAVAGRLWELVVVRNQLCDHLQAVRDLVLLGKGELWHELVLQGRDLMRQPPSSRSEDALRDGPLAAAKRHCGLESDRDPRTGRRSPGARLTVSLALESFVARQFDSGLAGFALHGAAAHDPDAKAVLLVPRLNEAAAAAAAAAAPGLVGLGEKWHVSGAVASVGAKKVRRSFSSLCKVSWATGGDPDPARALRGGAVHVGLLLTGRSSGGAQVPSSSVGVGGQAAGQTGACGASTGSFHGLHGGNGVGVCLELDAAGAHVAVVQGCRREAQPGAAPGGAPVQTLAQAPLLRRPLPDTGHWLLVEYDAASDATAPVLRVFFDDPHKKGPPVLELTLALHTALALDASDAAVVAVHAAVTAGGRHNSASQHSDAQLPAVAVAVHDWTFAAHKAAPPPAGSSSSSSALALSRALDVAEGWDELSARYRVAWPLNLVLTSDAAAVCANLFTTLLWPVKRVCVDLDHLWPKLMEYRRLPPANNVWLRPLHSLHGRMLFFVRNLQVYLQVDVVEVQHQALLAAVQAHQFDFDAVRRAHAHFLARLAAKSHVGVRPLVDGLKRLLRLCRHFASLVRSFSNAADIPHAEVAALAARFQTDSTYLFLLLDRTDAKELSARLDFNGWHSATATALTGAA